MKKYKIDHFLFWVLEGALLSLPSETYERLAY